jgi:hypothetical protein
LRDTAAAIVADQVDLIDLERVEGLTQHIGVGGDGHVLISIDLSVAMRQQIHGNAPTRIGQSSQLATPDMLVQHDAVDEQRHWTGTGLGVADAPRRGVNAAFGECGLLVAP